MQVNNLITTYSPRGEEDTRVPMDCKIPPSMAVHVNPTLELHSSFQCPSPQRKQAKYTQRRLSILLSHGSPCHRITTVTDRVCVLVTIVP